MTPEPYEPGGFYKRELPFLLEAVAFVERRHLVEAVVIDGHVWLREGQPGLGARLHEALGARKAVIGVAKTAFAGGTAVPVLRGDSSRPLFELGATICGVRVFDRSTVPAFLAAAGLIDIDQQLRGISQFVTARRREWQVTELDRWRSRSFRR